MFNFRKLKQDFAPSILKEGRQLYDQEMIVSSKILKLTGEAVRVSSQVSGNFNHTYSCEIEIDRHNSTAIDSDCDCPYKYDCQHLAGLLFFLEENLNRLIVDFSNEADLDNKAIDKKEKIRLQKTFKEAQVKEVVRRVKINEKELLKEYINASKVLGQSPFFLTEEELFHEHVELALIFEDKKQIEVQLALRLPFRSKPLLIPHIKEFLDGVICEEPVYVGSKKYLFKDVSFNEENRHMLKQLVDSIRLPDSKGEKTNRVGFVEPEKFGNLLADIYDLTVKQSHGSQLHSVNIEENATNAEEFRHQLPGLYLGSLEEPLCYSKVPAELRFELEYLISSTPKILLKPKIILDGTTVVSIEDVSLFESSIPGMIYQKTYYRFHPNIKRRHLRSLEGIRDLIVPEPLFGTFVENSLHELLRFVQVSNKEIIDRFVTLPFVGKIEAECDIHYLNGELEAVLYFVYDKLKIPQAASQLHNDHISSFSTQQGILARNLTEEQKIVDDLFQDFLIDEAQGLYIAKTDRKIIEFMTEVIPRNQDRVKFNCPENLLDRFIFNETKFQLYLSETDRIDVYEVDLKVDGHLKGLTVDQLWECLACKRAYIELAGEPKGTKKKGEGTKNHKILVLDLEKLAPVVQIFDEIGINKLNNHKEERPLWSLASIDSSCFEGLPIEFKMSKKLEEIQKQMLGLSAFEPQDIPKDIQVVPRGYQIDGISWLERLRHMRLNGVLADDMGLGKTLQAIIAVTQNKMEHPDALSIVVCPTSLVYNWKEEFQKFNPKLNILPVDGTPAQRKKLFSHIRDYDVIITSYSLLQKDVEFYKTLGFSYAILDEAHHIKNRGTRNAKSVKMLQAAHRLILTGTPIENSLEELWSLFDFLMPGLLSTYDRFVEKYIRSLTGSSQGKNLEMLRKKVSPFILRRMKTDVLSELPPVSEIVYHCHLSEVQKELYKSYAESAREELAKLVKAEGFEKVQIHVLATLTRLKQICCHPAIFAKEKAEGGDSAKYDMLLELLQTLIEGKHKAVIFSQYTKMLKIIRDDLQKLGIPFEYLDGTSKNRLGIVKKFNEDPNIPVFLVSLKAGGSGLNLIGADTVIHYDMWWNPAVETQATDRVHRLGQKQSVSAYKLVTLNTIEEKIIVLQNRKKELVRQVVSCDEEAISKLTWEEVLELLQT